MKIQNLLLKLLVVEEKKAKGLCPLALSHQENDFPGPLIF